VDIALYDQLHGMCIETQNRGAGGGH
jgi:hypothetical protein